MKVARARVRKKTTEQSGCEAVCICGDELVQQRVRELLGTNRDAVEIAASNVQTKLYTCKRLCARWHCCMTKSSSPDCTAHARERELVVVVMP